MGERRDCRTCRFRYVDSRLWMCMVLDLDFTDHGESVVGWIEVQEWNDDGSIANEPEQPCPGFEAEDPEGANDDE